MMEVQYIVGVAAVVATCVFVYTKSSGPSTTLRIDKKIKLSLSKKEIISHDTRLFRFALPNAKAVLGLPTGKHISLSYRDQDGKLVSRPYTPVSSDLDVGFVDIVVKIYFANVHPSYPSGGKMSQHLEGMEIGDTIDVAGPKGKLTYLGRGKIEIKNRPTQPAVTHRVKKIGMIAGGTGITPMLQIIRAIMRDSSDRTEVSLIFANQTEKDILLRKELEQTAAEREGTKVWYTLDRPPEDWEYSSGFVNAEMIEKHLPAPGDDTMILMCGPPPMIKFACMPALEELGYKHEACFAF